MIRRPPRSTRTDTLFPYTTLFRSRFTFYFPAQEEWGGRMYHPLEGAHAGHEEIFAGMMGQLMGGLPMIVRLGGYMVESNCGHIGDDIDARAGADPTLYGYRAGVRSEERRVGKECVSTFRYRWSPNHKKKNKIK